MLRDQSGTTALEFALTAPVFFLFIFGVIELGLLFWTQIGLQHGAEMAAAIVEPGTVGSLKVVANIDVRKTVFVYVADLH